MHNLRFDFIKFSQFEVNQVPKSSHKKILIILSLQVFIPNELGLLEIKVFPPKIAKNKFSTHSFISYVVMNIFKSYYSQL